MHADVINLMQGSQPFPMGEMAVGQENVLEFVVVRFDEIDQFQVDMTGVDQQRFAVLLGRYQIGVAETDHGKVLIYVQFQWRVSS